MKASQLSCRSQKTEHVHIDRAGRDASREDRARRAQPQGGIADDNNNNNNNKEHTNNGNDDKHAIYIYIYIYIYIHEGVVQTSSQENWTGEGLDPARVAH